VSKPGAPRILARSLHHVHNSLAILGVLVACLISGCVRFTVTSDPPGARLYTKVKTIFGEIDAKQGRTPFSDIRAESVVGLPCFVVWPDGTRSDVKPLSGVVHFVKPDYVRLRPIPANATSGSSAEQDARRQAAEVAARERAERERLERELAEAKAKGAETQGEQERLRQELATLKAQQAQAATRGSRPPGPVTPRWAVVIGIDEYQALGKLTVCRNDAKTLAQVLIESGGYAEGRVVLMTDDAAEPQNRPTLATMKRRIEQVASLAGKDETVLVYFSGHGITKDGQGYLVPMDGDADSAVPLASVKDTLVKSKAASKVLILDACHAGSAAKGVGGIAPSLVSKAKDIVMFLSSAADQVSYPDEVGTRSVFSKYVTEGLSGAADTNRDGQVTSGELFDYVRRCMTDWSVKTGKSQTVILAPPEAPDVVLTGGSAAGSGK